jgi:hypothetical protein
MCSCLGWGTICLADDEDFSHLVSHDDAIFASISAEMGR